MAAFKCFQRVQKSRLERGADSSPFLGLRGVESLRLGTELQGVVAFSITHRGMISYWQGLLCRHSLVTRTNRLCKQKHRVPLTGAMLQKERRWRPSEHSHRVCAVSTPLWPPGGEGQVRLFRMDGSMERV